MLKRRSPVQASFLPLLAAAVFVALPCHGQSSTLELNPEKTEIYFDLPATGHDVHGVLEMTSGRLTFDPRTGEASGEITIDARKASTDNEKRDKKMHLKVLESVDFPDITFRPDHIEGEVRLEGESDFELVGTLTLLGKQHPFSLASHTEILDRQVKATASFPVPYIDWGLHNPSLLVLRVGKVVDVGLETVGTLTTEGDRNETGAGR